MGTIRESVLYYNPTPTENVRLIKGVLVQMGVRIRNVTPEQTGQKIGYLAGLPGFEETISEGTPPPVGEEMLVMKDFTGDRMDQFFLGLKKAGVPKIALKAVITETNSNWTLEQLYREIKDEHEKMSIPSGGKG